ncbi:MAG: F-box protein [Planctomycetota bacterium]|jgi:hypothetical protein
MKAEQTNNESEGADEIAGSFEDDCAAADAWPVCPKCLAVCHPLQHYCDNCDCTEAINPLVSYMPFVRIRFNIGMVCKLWQRVLYDRDMPAVYRVLLLLLIILAVLLLPGCGGG